MLNNDGPSHRSDPAFDHASQPASLARLRARFAAALVGAGATSDGGLVFEQLVARYGEAHRHYHTLAHIDACLGWLDWLTAHAERPAEVELALWFHDVVYDPQRDDNEQRSAELARRGQRDIGVATAVIDRVTDHIFATAHHRSTTGDTALLVDIDLSVLGAAPADFERFEQQVRREYIHVVEDAYRLGRTRVLQSFLSRPQLYATPMIRELLEARARNNLTARIAQLSSGGGR